jgi:hypothetical protein
MAVASREAGTPLSHLVSADENSDLCVEVRDQDIVVTMPGTSLRVVYRKPHRGYQLVARLDYFQDQQKGPITRAEFLAKALKLANDKARELGWIVEASASFGASFVKRGVALGSPLPT